MNVSPQSGRLGYDAASHITAYTESVAANNQSFAYDSLDRLTQTQGASTSGYTYPSTSNRLSQVSGPSPKTYSYDAMGNLLADGSNTYSYNARGRLSYVSYSNRSNGYHHNGLGQRVAKSGWLAVTDFNIYAYDEQGHLLGDYDAYGAPIQETVYLGDTPVAVLGGTTPAPVVYPIYTDHLNTPRVIIDQTNKVIWRWDSDPFGSIAANEDSDGDGVKFTYNLRFPGQYYDRETGLHYNYFRDYDPRIGRYVESDPIGLGGGINTYAYANASPLRYIDPLGLWVKRCSRKLGGKDEPATNQEWYNLLRHDYLNVSGTILSFQSGSNIFWSQGSIDDKERGDNACVLVCKDDKFDKYVLEAASEIGAPTYCVTAYPGSLPYLLGARNCQTWNDDVLGLAKKKYLKNEKCPDCFK